jgi:E3 ubiquitin-protein ligase FANCL
VNPISPLSIPTYLFLGSDNGLLFSFVTASSPPHFLAISPLKVKFNSNMNRWDKGRNLRENIQALLEMNLPSPNNNLTYDTLVSECAICYCYKLEDEIPNKICDNQSCGKVIILFILLFIGL